MPTGAGKRKKNYEHKTRSPAEPIPTTNELMWTHIQECNDWNYQMCGEFVLMLLLADNGARRRERHCPFGETVHHSKILPWTHITRPATRKKCRLTAASRSAKLGTLRARAEVCWKSATTTAKEERRNRVMTTVGVSSLHARRKWCKNSRRPPSPRVQKSPQCQRRANNVVARMRFPATGRSRHGPWRTSVRGPPPCPASRRRWRVSSGGRP